MINFSALQTKENYTVFFDGKPHTVPLSSPNAKLAMEAVTEKNIDKLRRAFDLKTEVARVLAKAGGDRVSVRNKQVFVKDGDGNDREVTGVIVSRVLDAIGAGYDTKPIFNFLTKLYDNPSMRAINETYDFIEACSLPITPDGDFLAYKKVRADYLDVHSGTIRNQVGDTPSMPRNAVDEDKNNTCSKGLHFCSYSYLASFSGERIMVLKINPRDVVAIPADYNNAKGRACRYEVVEELATTKEGYTTLPVAPLADNFTDSHGADDTGDFDIDEADEAEEETYTDEKLQEIRDDLSRANEIEIRNSYYDDGTPVAQIAEDWDLPQALVSAILNEDKRSSAAPTSKTNDTSAKKASGNSLTDAQVREVRKLLAEGFPVASAARVVGTSARTVARIRDGETYTEVK